QRGSDGLDVALIKPAARKPQVKRRPKPAGDGMRPGFRR
ncbi:hypothetical protein, partial [Pseudomonas aeruginosa]